MLIARFGYIAIAAVLASGLAAGRETPSKREITEGRDLRVYDDGGKLSVVRYDPQRPANLERARDFIWSHWQQKARGYLRVYRLASVDYGVTSHIFIEPATHGWHIVWRELGQAALPKLPPDRLGTLAEIVSVTRGKDSALIFKDKAGKQVTRL